MRAENVTEVSVDEAVHQMVDNLPGAKLVDWTSAESTLLPKKANTGKTFCEPCWRGLARASLKMIRKYL